LANILVVDGDHAPRRSLRDLLEKQGHEARLAADADEALRVAAAGVHVDLVVVPTQTQRMTAADLVARLATGFPRVPVLLAGDDADALARAERETGAPGVQVRPLDAVLVHAAVRSALARAQGRAPAASPSAPERAGLPASALANAHRPSAAATTAAGPVVLLAEDNDILRGALLRVLRGAGLEVLEADGGVEALARATEHAARLQLLVTDLVMPGITGTDLAERVARLRPGLKVLFMSGYPADERVAAAERWGGAPVLQKPFRYGALVERVRALLA
jgi:DNA-binding NtrC family response regulator